MKNTFESETQKLRLEKEDKRLRKKKWKELANSGKKNKTIISEMKTAITSSQVQNILK